MTRCRHRFILGYWGGHCAPPCRNMTAEVEAVRGRADVLINNAGTTKFVALRDLEGLVADDFHRLYSVNVVGAFPMTRAFAPLLRKNLGGTVVNISSIASFMGTSSSIADMASKGVLDAVVRHEDVADAA